MQRQEALDLLKEIVICQAANPNWLSLKEKLSGNYEISIKGEYNKEKINALVQARKAVITETCESLTIC